MIWFWNVSIPNCNELYVCPKRNTKSNPFPTPLPRAEKSKLNPKAKPFFFINIFIEYFARGKSFVPRKLDCLSFFIKICDAA